MHKLAQLIRKVWIFLLLALFWLAPLAAQAQESGEEEEGKSWAIGYLVVLLGLSIGLVSVCLSNKRKKK